MKKEEEGIKGERGRGEIKKRRRKKELGGERHSRASPPASKRERERKEQRREMKEDARLVSSFSGCTTIMLLYLEVGTSGAPPNEPPLLHRLISGPVVSRSLSIFHCKC